MAKINIEVDTEMRTASIMLNGQAVSNVQCIEVCPVNDDMKEEEAEYGYKQTMVRISTCMKDGDVMTCQTIYAGEKDFAKEPVNLTAFAKQYLGK